MATSTQRAGNSWSSPEQEEPLPQEPLEYARNPVPEERSVAFAATSDHAFDSSRSWPEQPEVLDDVEEPLSGARVGEYVAMPGLPARGVVVVSLLSAVGCAVIDLLLTSTLTMFFDLCFIVVCLVGAMAVRRRDFFTTGVLPPLLLAVVVAALAVKSPSTFVQSGGVTTAFLTGLAEHATALVIGYAVALATLGGRISAARAR
jgi:hypothetical protein